MFKKRILLNPQIAPFGEQRKRFGRFPIEMIDRQQKNKKDGDMNDRPDHCTEVSSGATIRAHEIKTIR
ncbi:hypothetical protein [Tannerella forsythia]|uniref:Uncharacterized protein n=1 Tax=Tannerella forsythia TaxID=28112 RepID=A0A3P1ZB65_TANFO|nr:hypothetical protein [Tannerella forsythia]RRD62979.1 hypothetical protein EII40_01170 [Tannerella forsythia]RRD79536.1 hypothetical protein EII41_00070 [Tannerella forsythia]